MSHDTLPYVNVNFILDATPQSERISRNDYVHTSVCDSDKFIYAAVSEEKLTPQWHIHVYTCDKNSFKEVKDFKLPCMTDHIIAIAVGSDIMYETCFSEPVCMYCHVMTAVFKGSIVIVIIELLECCRVQ